MWNQQGDLICTTCQTAAFLSHGRETEKVALLARVKGWHIFEGETLGGTTTVVHLCPKCVGTNRSKLPPAPERLDGDQTLF
jgi:hypothetical protein